MGVDGCGREWARDAEVLRRHGTGLEAFGDLAVMRWDSYYSAPRGSSGGFGFGSEERLLLRTAEVAAALGPQPPEEFGVRHEAAGMGS